MARKSLISLMLSSETCNSPAGFHWKIHGKFWSNGGKIIHLHLIITYSFSQESSKHHNILRENKISYSTNSRYFFNFPPVFSISYLWSIIGISANSRVESLERLKKNISESLFTI